MLLVVVLLLVTYHQARYCWLVFVGFVHHFTIDIRSKRRQLIDVGTRLPLSKYNRLNQAIPAGIAAAFLFAALVVYWLLAN